MENTQLKKQQANLLRKQGSFKEALIIYRELFTGENRDEYNTAGYLHCLRKLKMFEEALDVIKKYDGASFEQDWCKNEIIWTYIGNIKLNFENINLSSISHTTQQIFDLNADDLQKKSIVLLVLKKAKQFKKWDIACQWVDEVDPSTLEKEPINLSKGKTVWSNYLIWHHYKINCLIHQKMYKEAIELIDNIKNDTTLVSKYFLRLKATIYEQLGQFEKSIEILEKLCENKYMDWWVVHQYANVLSIAGNKDLALEKLYLAATKSQKIKNAVTLFYDIAILCKETNKLEESYYHILLCKIIREKNDWPINSDIEKLLKEMELHRDSNVLMDYKQVLEQCKKYWNKNDSERNKENKQIKKALKGYLIQVKEDKPFCFIKSKTESYFCYKSDIKVKAVEGLEVYFNAIPSFDKKKKQESWKAIDIEVCRNYDI